MKPHFPFLFLLFILPPSIYGQPLIWQEIGVTIPSGSISAIYTTPTHYIFLTKTVGFGGPVALYRSSDDGLHWENVSGVVPMTFGVNPSGDLFASGPGSYFSRSTDNGNSWAFLSDFGFSEGPNTILAMDKKAIFVQTLVPWNHGSYAPGPLYRSTDNGDTWSNVGFSPTPPSYYTRINALSIANDSCVLAASAGDVFRSTDLGLTWNSTNSGQISPISFFHTSGLTNYLYAMGTQGIFRSIDKGATWTQVNNGLTDSKIAAFASSANGYFYAGTDSGLFTSQNEGDNWTSCGFQNQSIKSVVVDTAGTIFVNSTAGIFFSSDLGQGWKDFNSGLPDGAVSWFDINSADFAFVLIDNRIYRTSSAVSVTVSVSGQRTNIPSIFTLDQNFPNPFNPSTIIQYQLPTSGQIRLRLSNLLGQEAATLADGQQSAGIHKVVFNAANLTSGVYFYSLEFQNRVLTRRLLFLK